MIDICLIELRKRKEAPCEGQPSKFFRTFKWVVASHCLPRNIKLNEESLWNMMEYISQQVEVCPTDHIWKNQTRKSPTENKRIFWAAYDEKFISLEKIFWQKYRCVDLPVCTLLILRPK